MSPSTNHSSEAAAEPSAHDSANAPAGLERWKELAKGRRWLQPPLLWGRSLVRRWRIWRERPKSRALDGLLAGYVPRERPLLQQARQQFAGKYRRPLEPPLISITVATYNRSSILLDRTLPSLLAQDYPRFEIVIVGDRCTDDTMQRLQQLKDRRVRFENLAERQPYPNNREQRHLVAGVRALNRAIALAQGDWIAQCDDDEMFVRDHLRLLWEFAERRGYEFVWGQQLQEVSPGCWIQQGSATPHLFDIPHTTLLYRSYLRCFPYCEDAWQTGICHDRHRLRRMRLAGARGGFLPRVVTIAPLRPQTTRAWGAAEDLE